MKPQGFIEDHPCLTIELLKKHGYFRLDEITWGAFTWKDRETEAVVEVAVLVCLKDPPYVHLVAGGVDCQIMLEEVSACWFFVCPDCQKKRMALSLVKDKFACSGCHRLVHDSPTDKKGLLEFLAKQEKAAAQEAERFTPDI